ncbi:hypothetical protein C9374_005637 [Naegleria lovaniensis]|uniref:Histidine kinase n=1 Tax=Naegleria lovaniensis TaxID=51637 RepID=A0AA88GLI2_NAELO|nr:uncharacterized protein C9374_005637 [Naegleria lovaniensis]KAG2382435.1 hypothetical protein C9374_005637 [Naegleria lovaniensis]
MSATNDEMNDHNSSAVANCSALGDVLSASSYIITTTTTTSPTSSSLLHGTTSVFPNDDTLGIIGKDDDREPQQIRKNRSRANNNSLIHNSEFTTTTAQHHTRTNSRAINQLSLSMDLDPNLFLNYSPRSSPSRTSSPSTTTNSSGNMSIQNILDDVLTLDSAESSTPPTIGVPFNDHHSQQLSSTKRFSSTTTPLLSQPSPTRTSSLFVTTPNENAFISTTSSTLPVAHQHTPSSSSSSSSSFHTTEFGLSPSDTPSITCIPNHHLKSTPALPRHNESLLTSNTNKTHQNYMSWFFDKLAMYTVTLFSLLLSPKIVTLLGEDSSQDCNTPLSPDVHSQKRRQSLQDDESLIIKFKSRHEELAKNNPKLMIGIAILLIFMTYFFINPTTHSYFIFWLGFIVEMSMNITVDHILCTTNSRSIFKLELINMCRMFFAFVARLLVQLYYGPFFPFWILQTFPIIIVVNIFYYRREFSIINTIINMVGTCFAMHVAALWEFERTKDEFVLYATKTKILETIGLQFIIFVISYQFSYMMERQGDENTKKQFEILKQQIMNTSKTKFIGNLSHEARNPLQGILLSVQLLQNEINSTDNQQQVFSQALKETLDDIYYNATLLLHIFSTSLQMSNLELGSIKLNENKFSLLECIENMISVFGRAADEKGISIGSCYNFNSLSKYNFLGDQTRVSQILVNIVSNALKFTEKGFVFLSCDTCTKSELKQLKMREDPQYTYIKIVCEDTGIGMSHATQQNLFKKPFYRIDSDTVSSAIQGSVANFNPIFEQYFVKSLSNNSDLVIDDKSSSEHDGSTSRGFGISITKSLVDLMGGKILVSSELGRGTKVTVILPLKNLPLSEQVDLITSDFEYKSENRSISACSKELHEAVHYCIPDFYLIDSNPLTPLVLKPYLSFIFPSSKFVITDKVSEIKISQEQKLSIVIYNQAVCDSRAFESIAKDCVLIPMNNRGQYTEHRYLSRPIRFKDLLEVLLFYVKSRPIELPLMSSDEKSSSSNQIDDNTSTTQKAALVVEDNDINRKVLAKMLRGIGFEIVDCCENGLDGVEKFKQKQNQYGIILMDLLMPVMDGKEACSMISQLQKDSSTKTPVVAVTANIWETKERLLAQGFSDVLYKPITLKNLKTRLSEIVN